MSQIEELRKHLVYLEKELKGLGYYYGREQFFKHYNDEISKTKDSIARLEKLLNWD